MKLEVRTKIEGTDFHIELVGILDEAAELPEVEDGASIERVIVNLAGLTMINSLGCRRWVEWIKSLEGAGEVVLEACSVPVVHQMNILSGFVPKNVQVTSFMVPYHCNDCGAESQLLMNFGGRMSQASIDAIAVEVPCSECKAAMMELDVIKSRYFGFLARRSA